MEFLGKLKLPLALEKYLEPGIKIRGDGLELVSCFYASAFPWEALKSAINWAM
ncbi:MAG: hypothetical protein ACM3SY_00805 [Candidatus Omnitrophota bacterium]